MNADGNPNIIVIGASAGGVPALQKIAAALPQGLNACVCIVLHLAADFESLLPQILSRAGLLAAEHPPDNAPFETGRVYVAPTDRHLLFHDGRLRVVRGPKENGHRPSIDVLFRSAATEHGPKVIGVLLTGSDDDGAAGLKLIKDQGGTTVVQDPLDAAFPHMPQYAIRVVQPDFTLAADRIGTVLAELVRGSIEGRRAPVKPKLRETVRQDEGLPIDVSKFGTPTAFVCPDCSGTLWEVDEGGVLRYRCRVGHAFSAISMLESESEAVDRALWVAIRALEESAAVSRRVAEKTDFLREEMMKKAEDREHNAKLIRELLVKEPSEDKSTAD